MRNLKIKHFLHCSCTVLYKYRSCYLEALKTNWIPSQILFCNWLVLQPYVAVGFDALNNTLSCQTKSFRISTKGKRERGGEFLEEKLMKNHLTLGGQAGLLVWFASFTFQVLLDETSMQGRLIPAYLPFFMSESLP